MTANSRGLRSNESHDMKVYVEPRPMRSINGRTAAVDPAPVKHLGRLFAAVAAPACPGCRSTINALRTLKEPVRVTATRKSRTRGAARGALDPMAQS